MRISSPVAVWMGYSLVAVSGLLVEVASLVMVASLVVEHGL